LALRLQSLLVSRTYRNRSRPVLRVLIGLAALTLATGALSATAVAAPFVGVMADGPMTDGSVNFGHQASLMARQGVQTVRVAFYWPQSQPSQISQGFQNINGVPTSFDVTDKVVAACAQRRLDVLPVVVQAPIWARIDPSKEWSPPADPNVYADFVATLVKRYGPTGSFWASHPALPRIPIRYWQIWNEPAGGDRPNDPSVYWDDPAPFQDRYVSMLRATKKAMISADPGAKLVLGGLFGRSWESLQSLYHHGARGLFDVVAVHPFAATPTESLKVAHKVRSVMRTHGDSALPLFVTELSWDSSDGKVPGPDVVATTKAGQAKRLLRAFRLFAGARRHLRLKRVYWYTWITRDSSSTSSWDYSGLLHLAPNGAVSAKPAFAAFGRIARWVGAGARAGQAPS
jgi:polysaccharide biosynthesis protein PslG